MAHELVRYEVADGVATVTLNNPEKRNMLSGQMLVELVDAMKAARASTCARAVVGTPAPGGGGRGRAPHGGGGPPEPPGGP
ncbi:MAG: enoyl-CoA hydratase-related protein, partial [Solirubrobacterales bacterium]